MYPHPDDKFEVFCKELANTVSFEYEDPIPIPQSYRLLGLDVMVLSLLASVKGYIAMETGNVQPEGEYGYYYDKDGKKCFHEVVASVEALSEDELAKDCIIQLSTDYKEVAGLWVGCVVIGVSVVG
eukprot:gene18248-21753_t